MGVLLTGDADRSWEIFGRTDPYYGVVSWDEFHRENLDEETRAEFFATGEHHVQAVLEDIGLLAPGFSPRRALDFGCGVARLLIPLARCSDEAVGVDISRAMLLEACANCQRFEVDNVELLPSDDQLSAVDGTFDLIHSFIVFQHIPVRRGEAITRALLDRLEEGGVAALHFTFASRRTLRGALRWLMTRIPLAHNVANVVRGRPFGRPVMQINNYDIHHLLAIIQDEGDGRVLVRQTDHNRQRGVMLYFRKPQESPVSL